MCWHCWGYSFVCMPSLTDSSGAGHTDWWRHLCAVSYEIDETHYSTIWTSWDTSSQLSGKEQATSRNTKEGRMWNHLLRRGRRVVACAFVRGSCVLRWHGVGHSSHTSIIIQGVDLMMVLFTHEYHHTRSWLYVIAHEALPCSARRACMFVRPTVTCASPACVEHTPPYCIRPHNCNICRYVYMMCAYFPS